MISCQAPWASDYAFLLLVDLLSRDENALEPDQLAQKHCARCMTKSLAALAPRIAGLSSLAVHCALVAVILLWERSNWSRAWPPSAHCGYSCTFTNK
jgi:hypothetical protein